VDDPLQPYRQPLVTATGIVLGFVLNFANSWVRSDTSLGDVGAYGVGSLVLAGMICLIVVLARILRVGVDSDRVTGYYRRTVNVFLIGVTLAVAGAAIDMYSNFQSS
jgi:hypothetical protein